MDRNQTDFNESDPNNAKILVANQVKQCINLLKSEPMADQESRWKELVSWCDRWDQVHGYHALSLYPELSDIFVRYGYAAV